MSVASTTTQYTNNAVVRTTTYRSDHLDYSWALLALLAMAMIAAGLRKLFWDKSSN